MHNEQLIAAMQKRCHFEPGEVRVVLLDAQPIHTQTQEYRLVDAATGEFERGYVKSPTWSPASRGPTTCRCTSTSAKVGQPSEKAARSGIPDSIALLCVL